MRKCAIVAFPPGNCELRSPATFQAVMGKFLSSAEAAGTPTPTPPTWEARLGAGWGSWPASHRSSRQLMKEQKVDFALKVLQWSDSEVVRLQLWDIAGQERFTSMTRLYYRDASACVIMFDVTNATTFTNSQRWKQDLDSKLTLPNGEPVPCLLLANKCDLSPWAVSRDQVDRFSKENGFTGWTETSVKENKNINEAMRVLIEKMMSNSREDMSLSTQGDYINLQTKPSSSWACC
uniref:Ras-related protein Rab n=2 Tax=Felidae TaxID=9681 RepID=A0ABI7XWY8_FELCA